jgi:hypothetical protein
LIRPDSQSTPKTSAERTLSTVVLAMSPLAEGLRFVPLGKGEL